jgi:MFS family permease
MDRAEQKSDRQVLWVQVWALAAIQGAIILTWVIYNLYLVTLLVQFGFPKELATGILIIENVLAAVMEPLMGNFSDRVQRWVGTRFPLIAFGVIISSACFIGVPTVLVFGSSNTPIRWLLPIIMIAWALSMSVFRSPALSLLGRYAFATNLPQAASILTLVGSLAGAMAPLSGDFILALGPLAAFSIGSFVLLGAAGALRLVNPTATITSEGLSPAISNPVINISFVRLGLIFGTGMGVSLGFQLLMKTFPLILKIQVPTANIGMTLGGIFMALALSAIPSGNLATRLGNRQAMLLGLVLMVILFGLMVLIRNNLMAAIVALSLGASYSLVANGTIPFALSMVPPEKGGLGTGIYFSGAVVASSIFGALFGNGSTLTPEIGTLLGIVALIFAASCVASSATLQKK